MWQTITIQSQTNHTFELGPPCRNRWVRLALLKDGTPFTSQRASWERSSPSVCLTQDMAAMHRDIGGMGAHFMHAHMHPCMHTCTHLGGDSTDVDTSSVCAHTTCVSSADNRNNKHKQVGRPYKCSIVPVQIK